MCPRRERIAETAGGAIKCDEKWDVSRLIMVVIPTYNEKENISVLLEEIESLGIAGLEVVVVDDDSPDGTWEVIEGRMVEDSHLHLLTRMGERGRGLAGVAGFKYALDAGADVIVEMDGDFSHAPSYIPDFLKAIEKFDVVLGSRFVKGGGSERRNLVRRIISELSGLYIRMVLGLHLKDPTSGFRCFRRKVLERINLSTLTAKGPFIVTEVLFRCYREGFRIGEIPIVFRKRFSGKSKLSFRMLLRISVQVLKLKIRMKKCSCGVSGAGSPQSGQ